MKEKDLEVGCTYMVREKKPAHRSARSLNESGHKLPAVTRVEPRKLVAVTGGGFATIEVEKTVWDVPSGDTVQQVMLRTKGKMAVKRKYKRRVRTADILRKVA